MATAVDKVIAEPVPPAAGAALQFPTGAGPRHNYTKWALVAGAAIVLAVGVGLWRARSGNTIRFETAVVERGPIQASVTATGTLNAVVDVQVGSQVSGNIKALYADFNTKVTKGQLVALIDPQMFQTQVDQARAAVTALHSAVITAEAQVQKAESDLSGAMASEKGVESILAKDAANALNTRNQFQRQDELFKQGITSQQDHDSAKANMDAAEAQIAADRSQIDASKQNILSAEAQVSVAKAQLGSAQAQWRQAVAALDQARVNLTHTRITAPVDGTVIARRMDVGQTVAASFSAPTIFEIAQDLTKMQVDTNVDESDIGNVKAGQDATFTVDAFPGEPFYGKVVAVRQAPINTQNVVTYDVVISVANPDLKLLPGMTSNVRILTAKLDNVLKVPNAVLRFRPSSAQLAQLGLPPAPLGKQQVYTLSQGELRAVPVTLGLSDGRSTALTADGLREGDRVVVRFVTAAQSRIASTPLTPGSSRPRRGPGF